MTTPNVDWFALSPRWRCSPPPRICLLAAALLPPGGRRPFSAFIAAAGFVTAGVFAVLVFDDTRERALIVER